MDYNDLKYPIGRYEKPALITPVHRQFYIADMENMPRRMRNETEHLTDAQLDTPYRENGWTLRQVVHHCADSHINSFTRFKLSLTEDKPIIKSYREERWAELPDSKTMAIRSSLDLLEALHHRWVMLLKSLTEEEWQKCYIHPDDMRVVKLDEAAGLYAWHGNHHLSHITQLKQRMGWE